MAAPKYDIDYDFPFVEGPDGLPLLPDDVIMDGDLYVLPNGRYMPPGVYLLHDDGLLLYEPRLFEAWRLGIIEE